MSKNKVHPVTVTIPETTETAEAADTSNTSEEREKWHKKAEFLLSCIGYAVGLGNIWRFPYLCYKHGGASFLIPYFLTLITCGIPLFYLELALGQYLSLGPVKAWAVVCPVLAGLSYKISFVFTETIMSALMESFTKLRPYKGFCLFFLCIIQYLVGLSCVTQGGIYVLNIFDSQSGGLSLIFMVIFEAVAVSWGYGVDKFCNNIKSMIGKKPNIEAWGNFTSNCTSIGQPLNCTMKLTSPSEEFWERYILAISSGIDEPGELRLPLVICLLIAWTAVFCCLYKGIKSSGKVAYFTAIFPYVVLFALLVRGVTLPGAVDGIIFYLKPDFSKLLQPQVR
ncbi:sodium- and chloride-dependent betaine transporter-like [Orbicella faveolata]|uniref:sodium- and chloride-dependent betaine transporter-like n=1 Tax=Orbicella faveolata TaxID=48498 RepID=UPI0009E28771|nr:sodium- and chloride-dependent betaine transporter-like [Orbicella faveolata]